MTVGQALLIGARYLERHGLRTPREDCELLLTSVLKSPRSFLFAHPEVELEPGQRALFRAWLRKRAAHYPIQYLRGFQEFYGRDFSVRPGVLIPRPETETLVDTALAFLRELPGPTLSGLDIGTGSGCIAITLSCEEPRLRMTATDVSQDCLEAARQNSVRFGCSDRIEFVAADIIPSGLHATFDLIISNPPYVNRRDWPKVDISVRLHEPPQAVFAPDGGLAMHRRIFAGASAVLRDSGRLFLEIGFDQSEAVVCAGKLHGWHAERSVRDLSGTERCIVFSRPRRRDA